MKELYQANDRFMFRIPTVQESETAFNETEILTICRDKNFREKMKIASPSLINMMDMYINNPDNLTVKKKNDFYISLMKYYIRSKERPTPFGLFSAVGLGQFDKTEQLYNHQLHFQKKVNVDSEWLFGYIKQLEEKYDKQLEFKINSACHIDGNRVVVMYTTNKEIDEISIRYTRVYKILETVCRSFLSYEEIFQEIKKYYPDIDGDTIREYIAELIRKQILISNLRPPFVNVNQLDYLKQQCERVKLDEIAQSLKHLQAMCFEYESTQIGEGMETYEALIRYMGELYKSKYYVQVDTLVCEADIKLDDSIKQQVERLATFLVAMSSISQKQFAYLDKYRDSFLEKYGFEREVPVLEMLDAVNGIGAPSGYMFPANDFFDTTSNEVNLPTDTRNYFMDQYEKALFHRKAIQLEWASVQKNFELPDLENAPLSFELYFSIKNVNGKKRLYLGENGGSMCAGKTFGRFSMETKELAETLMQINKREQELRNDNVETCEVNYLPSEVRSGNVVRCKTGREKYLTAYTNTVDDEKEIRLEDILIGATETQFYARNAKTGNHIVFGANNMFNIMLQPNAYRFLLEIAHDGKIAWCDFPWKYAYMNCRHIPQIEFEGVILSSEQWFINRIALGLGIKEKSFEAFKTALSDYMEKEEIPTKICLVDDDNRMNLNLKSELALRILFDEFKKKGEESILIERTEEGDSVLSENGGTHATQIVVPVFRKKKDFFYKKSHDVMIDREQHIALPYEEWLYLKLYCKKEREEELIAFCLKDFCDDLKNEFGIEHFFMRYMDPKPHIRLRFYGDSKLLYQATPRIMEWIKEGEKQKIFGNVIISTYEKEVERYGGTDLIDTAEKLFRLDSIIVEEILCRKRVKQLNMNEIDITIISMIRYVQQFYDNFEEQLSYLTRNYHSNKYINEFRRSKMDWLKLFDLENDWRNFNEEDDRKDLLLLLNQRTRLVEAYNKQIMKKSSGEDFKNNIVNSVLHLHCNRLVGTNRELERKIMSFAEGILYAKKYDLAGKDKYGEKEY